MPVTFSIKNVPDELAEALRERARRNHRSLQGELMAVLQASIRADRTPPPAMREHTATYEAETLAERATTSGASGRRDVWGPSESAVMIRQMRDGREFTIQELYDYVRELGFETPAESARWIREDRRHR